MKPKRRMWVLGFAGVSSLAFGFWFGLSFLTVVLLPRMGILQLWDHQLKFWLLAGPWELLWTPTTSAATIELGLILFTFLGIVVGGLALLESLELRRYLRWKATLNLMVSGEYAAPEA